MICSFTRPCKIYVRNLLHVIITDINFEVIYQTTFEIGLTNTFIHHITKYHMHFPERQNVI